VGSDKHPVLLFVVGKKPDRFGRVNAIFGEYQRKLVFLPFCPQQLDNNKQSNDQ
jgi:hypothetical protein